MTIKKRSIGLNGFIILLTVLSLVVMTPAVFTTIVYITLGLGLSLVIAPNILLWIGLAMPLRRLGGIWALALIPVILMIPGFLAQQKAGTLLRAAQSTDVTKEMPIAPKKLRIVSENLGYSIASLRCDELCQSLFAQGAVTHLEYVNISKQRGKKTNKTRRMTYSFKNSGTCETDKIFKGEITANLLDMIAKGKCIIATQDMPLKGAVTVHRKGDIINKANSQLEKLTTLVRPRFSASIVISNSSGDTLATRSELSLSVMRMPFILLPVDMDGYNMIVGPWRKTSKTLTASFPEWVQKTLYPDTSNLQQQPLRRSLAERNSGKAERETATQDYDRALIILNSKDKSPIGGQQLLILQKAVKSSQRVVGNKQDRIAFELRLLGDQRIQDKAFLHQRVIQLVGMPLHQDDKAMPLLWKRYQAAKKAGRPTDEILIWISRVDPQYLKPYAKEIMAAVQALDISKAYRTFGHLGKLGLSPKNVFKKGLKWDIDGYNHIQRNTLYGICNSDKRWRQNLAPLLVDYVKQAEKKNGSPENLAKAIKTLETWNKGKQVTAPYRNGKLTKRGLDGFLKRYDKRPWDCGR